MISSSESRLRNPALTQSRRGEPWPERTSNCRLPARPSFATVGDLVQARDHLQIEVAERTQQASLLNLTHDPIFVRDIGDVITYWNRGAQELYGWTDKEAIGRHSQELLQTIFPTPLEDIRAELL
jgi:PAS domain-containing protein